MGKNKKDEIKAAWELFNDNDISTECLLQLVADTCSCTIDDVVAVMTDNAN